jgi:site-specific DNA-methyltransferase (adenine-specific)
MAQLEANSVDAICTDPPYGLGFMGRAWDDLPPGREWAEQCLRILKPGGHLLAFGGTRTWHRLACAIEDAGFEIRDSIAWLYGSGFPKSLDVSKAIDKAAGAEREILETIPDRWAGKGSVLQRATQAEAESVNLTAPATPEAQQWAGWGTALKPAHEPIVVARKPLTGTVAANVLRWSTGAINVDGCRIEGARPDTTRGASINATSMAAPLGGQGRILDDGRGRWPANVALDEHAAAELDKQSGVVSGKVGMTQHGSGTNAVYGTYQRSDQSLVTDGIKDSGGASRFLYTAKAGADERPVINGVAHPTVKPLSLMRWLVRLVTPPEGVVLDPFAGSGTTVEAAHLERFRCIAIEREADYLELVLQRIRKHRDPIGYSVAAGEDLGLFGEDS